MKSASEKASSMTASTDDAENDVDNDLHGVDVRTSTADIKSTLDDGTFYVMGKVGDNFGFFQYTAQYMPAHKAYLLLDGSTVLAPGLKMVFGETPPSYPPRGKKEPPLGEVWYTLSGTRLMRVVRIQQHHIICVSPGGQSSMQMYSNSATDDENEVF